MELKELMSHSRNLELVLDSMGEAVIAHDLERRITFFNRAAERLTGLDRSQVLGRDCHDVLRGGLCGSRCAFCDQCVPDFDLLTYPLELTDAAGRGHRVEMTVVPMTDEAGSVVGALASARDVTELTELRRALKRERSFQGLVGSHPAMQAVYERIREVAATDVSVLIAGESGTGKELVAAAIHAESDRAGGPFTAVDCGALPEGLLESELFGHVKGAFTGALRDKRGRFERAHGGTLLLDEIGELSPATQVKLLRVLQERRIEPVGGERTLAVDVRILSATHRDLRARVRAGSFRQDLFYRLAVVPIALPPLRQRRTDIPLLADHFLRRFAAEMGRSPPALGDAARERLLRHDWPGNVRELANAMQYALVVAHGPHIDTGHLPPEVAGGRDGPRAGGRPRRSPGRKPKLGREQLLAALERHGGNRSAAARELGVGRSTLYRALRALAQEEQTPG